jgi:transglutaminase-like putative cysteine protease
MNHRLTIAAAVAVILASVSEIVLINGGTWLVASIGAVIVVALAGTLTRTAPNHLATGATVLALVACMPLLTARSWYLKAAGALIIVCCALSGTRLRAFRPIADVVTYLAALLLYLNLILSGKQSWAKLVPTSKSLHHLTTLAHSGMGLAKFAPPVTGTRGVILLAAASIGLVAIVVDVIAVRLNRPAIAGLPLLVLYMAPIATAAKTGGIGTVVTFLLAATGYLGLLASDGRNRLRGWGRVVTVWHYAGEDERLGGADIRGLAATGRRIGLAAVCAAIVAPLVLPSLNLHRLFEKGAGGTNVINPGLPNPVDQLTGLLRSPESNTPVLTYRTSGNDAGEYLGVYTLNYNSAKGIWTLIPPSDTSTVGATMKQPTGLARTTEVTQTTTDIKLDHVVGSSTGFNFPVFFLPRPYWPEQLSVQGTWTESSDTLMIYSGGSDHSNMSYRVISGQADPTRAEEAVTTKIPNDIVSSYLGFKSPVTPQLTKIAQQITKGAKTPFDKAIALEKYFQSGRFQYTLSAISLPNTPQGLLDFLTKDRRGFCEQFAFAMAVLARLEGIPSRIEIGYAAGHKQHNGLWKVTTADAHAWPQLYFPGLGWMRFEPTPGGIDGQGSAQQPNYATQLPPITGKVGNGPGSTPTANPSKLNGNQAPGAHVRAPGQSDGGAGSVEAARHKGHLPIAQILLAVLVLLLLAGAVPGTARIISRSRRWRAVTDDRTLASAAWQEVCANLDDLGLDRKASESPRALARRISAEVEVDESARAALGRIAIVVERIRYAPTPAPAVASSLRADVKEVRRSLASNATTVRRLNARLFPSSTITPMARRLGQSVGQLTGWVATPAET